MTDGVEDGVGQSITPPQNVVTLRTENKKAPDVYSIVSLTIPLVTDIDNLREILELVTTAGLTCQVILDKLGTWGPDGTLSGIEQTLMAVSAVIQDTFKRASSTPTTSTPPPRRPKNCPNN